MTKKIKLPERLYYPIALAAEKLGCTVDDLIHFGATGQVEICRMMSEACVAGIATTHLPDEMIMKQGLYGNLQLGVLNAERGRSAFLFGLFTVSCAELRDWDMKSGGVFRGMADLMTPAHSLDEQILITAPIQLERDDSRLYLTAHEMARLTGESFSPNPNNKVFTEELPEHPRTEKRKSELIATLLKLIPDFDGENIEDMQVNTILNIIESLASSKGIEFDRPDKNTLAKYLGRK